MLFIFWVLSFPAFAEEKDVCGVLSKANDILECVRTRSPVAERLAQEKEATLNEASAGRRWLNPQISNQTLFGKNMGNEQAQFQIGIWQSIEFGSKSSYKREVSESLRQRADADFRIALGTELRQTGGDLVRLFQLNQELTSLEEAIFTFNKLIGQFASRPRLGSEQEVTLSLYKLSKGDFLIRKTGLLREQDEILARFKSRLELSESQIEAVLNQQKVNLPQIDIRGFPEESSPELRLVNSDLSSAYANLSLARSDVFSNIQVGPMAQFDSDGPLRSHLIGFQINIPFPLWNQNGYGVDAAAQRVRSAEIQNVMKKRSIHEEWMLLVRNYERLRELLNTVPSPNEIESRHTNVESHIYRGLVSSALVVETHRSLIDLQKRRHDAELDALNMLWRIYIIQGKTSEIHL